MNTVDLQDKVARDAHRVIDALATFMTVAEIIPSDVLFDIAAYIRSEQFGYRGEEEADDELRDYAADWCNKTAWANAKAEADRAKVAREAEFDARRNPDREWHIGDYVELVSINHWGMFQL